MDTLQIRDMSNSLHQLLQQRARKNHHSLIQQALSDLQQAMGGDPRYPCRQALADLQALASQQAAHRFQPSPEEMIHQDRSR